MSSDQRPAASDQRSLPGEGLCASAPGRTTPVSRRCDVRPSPEDPHLSANSDAASDQPLASRLLIAPIRLYKRFISPMLPPACRYTPTCSVYMVEAIEVHGPVRGLWLGTRRLCRCHPWGGHGWDPVPPKDLPNGKSG